MTSRRLLLAAFAFTFATACASAPGEEMPDLGPRGSARTITTADLANATQLNLLDYIVAERPNWLRSVDGGPSRVVVYIDDTRLGGASTLKSVTLGTFATVRYYDAAAAQQRFTGRDLAPVIQVITR